MKISYLIAINATSLVLAIGIVLFLVRVRPTFLATERLGIWRVLLIANAACGASNLVLLALNVGRLVR